jgi:SAM-dependent methyltransferase
MSKNKQIYDSDEVISRFYDQVETGAEDIALIRRLIEGRGRLRILEPFCGTGRIAIPLAEDGHTVVGLDQSLRMLARAREKVVRLPGEVKERISLQEADVVAEKWPGGFDLVILGGNCLYELANPEEQEAVIRSAAGSLNPGGFLYLDNDHMEGELDASWRKPGRQPSFPTDTLEDGTRLEGYWELVWHDQERRLVRARRQLKITYPDGRVVEKAYEQEKHPPSIAEMRGWVEGSGLEVVELFGDRRGSVYSDQSERAIFWAAKPGK